jgi:hypothetical protein
MVLGDGPVADESVKRAAQEYLAERLSEEGLTYEETQNRDAAVLLAPAVWKKTVQAIVAIVNEWNEVTKEQSLACKETMMGDLRIRCAGRPHEMLVRFEPAKRLVSVDNTARPEHEPKVVLSIEGFATDSGRDARLMRNREVVNLQMLVLGQLRLLCGMSRRVR